MRIAFDAKRAYHNNTGLGNYSRTLISDLSEYFPRNEYFLFNTKRVNRYTFNAKNIHEVLPEDFLSLKLPFFWRGRWMVKDLARLEIDLYHGLSHEIPVGIEKSTVKSVVTIHDLIFERYPKQYNPLDVIVYRQKFKHACRYSDRIIAISEQTKKDIVDFYEVDPNKIDVCYQSCDVSFNPHISEEQKKRTREKYHLPSRFFLSVGSIIERKNLLNICKAMTVMQHEQDIPLVVVGTGKGAYRKQIEDFIKDNGLGNQVVFLSEGYSVDADLPAIYSLAEALIYPSVYEGFGIPVLEALSTGTPVITSSVSCLPEAGGDAVLYVNPNLPEELAEAMLKLINDPEYVEGMIQRGFVQAEKFTNQRCATRVMETYRKILG